MKTQARASVCKGLAKSPFPAQGPLASQLDEVLAIESSLWAQLMGIRLGFLPELCEKQVWMQHLRILSQA